jgi:lysozyme-like protein
MATAQELAKAAKAAGFPADQIQTAVAVALAESGGRADAAARNNNGSYDYGAWQINTVHGSLLSQGDKFNINDNAKMAFTVWQRAGNSWSPWVAYKNQRYRTFLPQAALAAASANAQTGTGEPGQVSQAGEPTPAQATVTSPLESLINAFSNLTSSGLWLRIGTILFGAALFLFGLNKLTGFGDAVVSTGVQVAKVAVTKGLA